MDISLNCCLNYENGGGRAVPHSHMVAFTARYLLEDRRFILSTSWAVVRLDDFNLVALAVRSCSLKDGVEWHRPRCHVAWIYSFVTSRAITHHPTAWHVLQREHVYLRRGQYTRGCVYTTRSSSSWTKPVTVTPSPIIWSSFILPSPRINEILCDP